MEGFNQICFNTWCASFLWGSVLFDSFAHTRSKFLSQPVSFDFSYLNYGCLYTYTYVVLFRFSMLLNSFSVIRGFLHVIHLRTYFKVKANKELNLVRALDVDTRVFSFYFFLLH